MKAGLTAADLDSEGGILGFMIGVALLYRAYYSKPYKAHHGFSKLLAWLFFVSLSMCRPLNLDNCMLCYDNFVLSMDSLVLRAGGHYSSHTTLSLNSEAFEGRLSTGCKRSESVYGFLPPNLDIPG
jgi:hypothetical protein